jgi:virulence-associated protein VagC
MNEEDYDVVIDTLQKQIDILWKMTKSNMDNDMMNIMDDIRLQQINQLEQAITLWKETYETM